MNRAIVFLTTAVVWATSLGLAFCFRQAEAGEPTTRDLVRKYIQEGNGKELGKLIGFTKEVAHVVALDYSIAVRQDGQEKDVDPLNHQFQIGDQIQVKIQPVTDAYIYIFHQGASGEKTCLLPKEDRGEQAPLVKGGTTIKLPDDGYLEFVAPPGAEELIVVATEKPTADLASLSNVVFKKPDEQLTPAEQEVKKTMISTVNKTLNSIRERQAKSNKFRGLLDAEQMQKFTSEVRRTGATRGVLEEPPHDKSGSTFVVSATTETQDSPSVWVNIRLKSIPGAARP
jgi:hypothetical protein